MNLRQKINLVSEFYNNMYNIIGELDMENFDKIRGFVYNMRDGFEEAIKLK